VQCRNDALLVSSILHVMEPALISLALEEELKQETQYQGCLSGHLLPEASFLFRKYQRKSLIHAAPCLHDKRGEKNRRGHSAGSISTADGKHKAGSSVDAVV